MPFTQEFVESLIKQNQLQLEQIEKLNTDAVYTRVC